MLFVVFCDTGGVLVAHCMPLGLPVYVAFTVIVPQLFTAEVIVTVSPVVHGGGSIQLPLNTTVLVVLVHPLVPVTIAL